MGNNTPLISIGMPVYNGEQYIRQALNSLLAQDYENFELIISDNTSTDATWEILQEYAQKDSRIILHQQPKNIGIIKNFGFVLDKAQGEYFLWTAHDDYVSSNYLSTLVKLLLQDEHLELVGTKVVNISSEGTLIGGSHFKDEVNLLRGMTKICTFMDSHCSSWIHGMFRTRSIRHTLPKFWGSNSIVGADRLLLYYYILNNKIAVTNKTTFYSRSKPDQHYTYRPTKIIPYLKWHFRYSYRAFRLLFRADISLYHKLSLVPFFFYHFFVKWLFLSRRFVRVCKTRVNDFCKLMHIR